MKDEFRDKILLESEKLVKIGYDASLAEKLVEEFSNSEEIVKQLANSKNKEIYHNHKINHAIDLIRLTHYCAGLTPIKTAGEGSELYTLNSIEDLFWLKPMIVQKRRIATGVENKNQSFDIDYTGPFTRINNRNQQQGFPHYQAVVNTIGGSSPVIDHIGGFDFSVVKNDVKIPQEYELQKEAVRFSVAINTD